MWQHSEYRQFARKSVHFISVIIDMRRGRGCALKHSHTHTAIADVFEACRSSLRQQVCQETATWFTFTQAVYFTSSSLHAKRRPHFATNQNHPSKTVSRHLSRHFAAGRQPLMTIFPSLNSLCGGLVGEGWAVEVGGGSVVCCQGIEGNGRTERGDGGSGLSLI